LKKSHSGNVQQNVDDVVVLAVSSLRSDSIQRHKWRRLREMHTYGAATSSPSLVQKVWWRDRLDQQHDGVVLMVENFCSRASPTCSREREKWKGQQLAGSLGWVRGELRPSPPLYRRLGGQLSPSSKPRAGAKGGGVGGKFSPSF
jgi:hypothetical protein